MQEMPLDYHFTVEQEVGAATHAFFGFNGVWRIAAINKPGGWKDRITVEDMDLAVRTILRGWRLSACILFEPSSSMHCFGEDKFRLLRGLLYVVFVLSGLVCCFWGFEDEKQFRYSWDPFFIILRSNEEVRRPLSLTNIEKLMPLTMTIGGWLFGSFYS